MPVLLQLRRRRARGTRGCRRRTSSCSCSSVQHLEQRLHPHRPRVLVGRQHAGVDDQHPARGPAVALELRLHAVRPVRGERRRPLPANVAWLTTWCRFTPPVSSVPEVWPSRCTTLRLRLVEHLAPRRAHGEGDVGVLVVRRRVAQVEAAELAEQRRGNREARAGAVVDLAQVVVLRLVGVVVAAVVPRRAVAPDDAAGFLQPAVRIDELGADQPGLGMVVEHREQRVEPARRARSCRC